MSSDPINPKHYKHLPVEAIDIIMAAIAKAPSNESAYLQGQVLKYLLRCWSKKGIEDLRKAKWYLDRLIGSFDDLLAEINAPILEGANNNPTANPNDTQLPSGCRWLKCGETLIGTDEFIRRNGFRDTIEIDLVGEKVEVGNLFIRKIEPPPKRYREPTQADLRDGPIECEYRDNDNEQWRSGFVVYILDGSMSFLCMDKMDQFSGQWNQCRIEAQEPPKRYREPTLEDLKNGPIECEVRDCDIQAWRKAKLRIIYPDAAYQFQVQKHDSLHETRYAQCRIEVTE